MDTKLFYGLKQMPSEKETRFKKTYIFRDMKNVLDRLDYLKQTKGIGVFTGQPGCGKTYTVRTFANELNPSLYKVVYLQLSTVSVLEFYRQLAVGLGLEPKFRKVDLFRQIQDTIRYLTKEKKCTPIIIVDEAQYLSNQILNDLKLLLNFDMDSKNYCILILIGQSTLNGILKKHIHDALRQRIIINYDLEGISREEAKEYIEHCLKQSGANVPIFSEEAIEAVYSIGQGSLRKMNNILTKCLIEGANEEARVIDAEIVLKAHDEVELT